jgi:ACS family glucarate transporter-like MFS transporter
MLGQLLRLVRGWARIRVRWWIFTYMFLFAMVSYIARTSIITVGDSIKPALHLTEFELGLLAQSFVVTYTIMQVPAATFGQRYGARLTYVLVGLVGFVATIATPLAPMLLSGMALYAMLVASQAVLGISQAPVFPVFAGVIEPWFPARQWSFANGLQSSGMTLGAAITPTLIVVLTDHLGWQGALIAIAVPGLLMTLLWGWYGRNTPREHRAVTAEELAELGELASEQPAPMTWARLARIASDRNVLLLAFSYVCMNYVFYLLTYWVFVYLVEERHLTALNGGLLAAIPPCGAAVGSAVGGALGDLAVKRFGLRRGYHVVPMISLPLAGVLLLVAVHVDSPAAVVLALALAFAGAEITEGPFWAATMQVARADTMAATGVLNTGGNIGGLISIPIVAYLAGHGGWTAAFVTGTGFALVSAATWLLIDPSRRARVDGPTAASGHA